MAVMKFPLGMTAEISLKINGGHTLVVASSGGDLLSSQDRPSPYPFEMSMIEQPSSWGPIIIVQS